MKGLVLKDLLNLKQQAKIYLLIVAIWFGIGFADKNASFFSGVTMMLTILIPMTAIGYDDKAKWDRYALTMPISKTQLAISKHLLGLLCAFAGMVLSLLFQLIAIGVPEMTDLIKYISISSLGIIILSILLPLIFYYGIEKARLLFLIVILIPSAGALLISKMNIQLPSEETIMMIIKCFPLVAVIVFVISLLISICIMNRKEF